jgi:hypothetical protein
VGSNEHANSSADVILEDIETSAKQGCHLCYLQCQSLSDTERTELAGCKRIRIHIIPYSGLYHGSNRPCGVKVCVYL